MMTRCAALLFVMGLLSANGRAFLGAHNDVDSAYIGTVIQGALHGMLGSGHGVDPARLSMINTTLVPIFNVLPKNKRGRLSAPFFRYAVRRYFSQRHGWIVKGFEPHAVNQSERSDMQSATVMQNKVPGYVEAMMEQKLSNGGFALQDMVIAVAAIEALIFDETVNGVEVAYSLNMLDTARPIHMALNLTHVLTSYFLVEHLDGNSTDIRQHWAEKRKIKHIYPHWPETVRFIGDILGEDTWQRAPSSNPFRTAPRTYSFEDMVRIARVISERFGPYSNHECHDMKLKLAEMDVHGTGRVKLADFYKSSKDGAWQFLETSEYLAAIGALDKSSDSLGPQVIIPNYITGSNNCISSSVFYDVCCLNECDGIFQHLEAHIKAPTASAAEVARALEEGIALSPLLSSTAPTEPRNLSAPLREMLQQVAAHHDDVIPLHGRLFAQWLHYAFPQECPYPHMSGTVGGWETVADLKRRNAPLSATTAEMAQFIESDAGRAAPSPEAGLEMWTLQEELLGPAQMQASWGSYLRTALHVIGLLSFSVLLLKEVLRLARVGSLWQGKKAPKVVEYDI